MPREVPPTAGLPLRWSDFFGGGELEPALRNFLGVNWLKVECSGTACLIIALRYLKSKSDRSTVVVSGYTCPLVAIAVAQAGLKIQLCDTAPDSYDFNAGQLEEQCNEDTLAIIVTHFGGLAADVAAARSVADKVGAFLIEDNAQSLGAKLQGQPLGTMSDIGIFSLSAGKGLTIYQGGFMVASDPEVQSGLDKMSAELVRSNFLLEMYRTAELIGYGMFYSPDGMRYVYGDALRAQLAKGNRAQAVGDVFPLQTELARVGTLRKRVGASAINRLPAHVAAARRQALQRVATLKTVDGVKILDEPDGCEGSWPFLTVVFAHEDDCEKTLATLWAAGVGVTKLFVNSLTGYDYLAKIVPRTNIPNSDSFAARTLTVSNSQWLSDSEFSFIVRTIQASVSCPKLNR